MVDKKSGEYIKCFNCGKEIYRNKYKLDHNKYHCCSIKCKNEYMKKNKGKYVNCSNCNKKIYVINYKLKHSKYHYCNLKCKRECKNLRKTLSKIHKGITYEKRFGKEKANSMKRAISKLKKGFLLKKKGFYKGCKICDNNFYVYPTEEKGRERIRKYCSSKCSGINQRGKPSWNKGIPHTEKHKKKLKEKRKLQITPVKDTSIEVKIQNFLKKLGIEFFTHQYIKIEHGYQCDILIPLMNLVIECDGDYWHKYPIGREIDHIRTSELLKKGFRVLRLWEFEIKAMNLNEFKQKLNIYKTS